MNSEEKIYRLTIRLPETEHELAKILAKYLYERGALENDSINELVRWSILAVACSLKQQLESEGLGGDVNGDVNEGK